MTKIAVKTMRGQTYSFSLLSENPTIGEIREQVKETINNGSDDFNLIFKNKLIPETPTEPLSNHQVTNGTTLHFTQFSEVKRRFTQLSKELYTKKPIEKKSKQRTQRESRFQNMLNACCDQLVLWVENKNTQNSKLN